MLKLLPELGEIKPITDDRKTFVDSPFTQEFGNLSFKSQLQIVNDLVRQTILTKTIANPENEIETMTGDSYTAAVVAIEYMKHLNIGRNHKLVFARKRSFDADDVTTTHFLVLVEDDIGNIFQFDCSPFVGYKCGKVENIKVKRFFEEYVTVEGEIKKILTDIRRIMYAIEVNEIPPDVNLYELLESAKKYQILKGYIDNCYSMLGVNTSNFNLNSQESQQLLVKQLETWKEELLDLAHSDKHYDRQIELAQSITHELKKYDPSLEKYLEIDGEKIPLSHLTPRYFFERGLNVVIIKPSAFFVGVSSTIKERFLKRGNGALGEYITNLGTTGEMGIKLMRIFHPHGYKYERSMCGPCDVFLINERADVLYKKKKELRSTLCKNLANKTVTWFDGEPLYWDPIITNLVHSTDDPSEACMHYVCAYPEHQVMTRFMYPNYKMQF